MSWSSHHTTWYTHWNMYKMFQELSSIYHTRCMNAHYEGNMDKADAWGNMRSLMHLLAMRHLAWSGDHAQIPMWSKTLDESETLRKTSFGHNDPWFEDTDKRPIVRKVSKEMFHEEVTKSYLSAVFSENLRRVLFQLEDGGYVRTSPMGEIDPSALLKGLSRTTETY